MLAPPPGQPLATNDAIFTTLLELEQRLARGDRRIDYRFHRGEKPVEAPEPYLPRSKDRSLRTYVQRVAAEVAPESFGVVVNAVQALDAAIWQRAARFLAGLYAEVGIPSGGSLIDLFFGNYRRSFLDFHKDDQDVFTFIIDGEKRILLWPFETFRDVAGLSDVDRGTSFTLRGFDYAPYRDRAIVLEGRAGDLFYWPASMWHVAEGDGTSCPVTLTVAVIVRGAPTLRAALGPGEGGQLLHPFAAPTHPYHRHLGRLHRVFDAPSMQGALEETVLRFVSRGGFGQLPDPLRAETLQPSDWLVRSDTHGLVWLDDAADTLWAAHGAVFRDPLDTELPSLFGRLNSGSRYRVDQLASSPTQLRALELLVQHRVLTKLPAR